MARRSTVNQVVSKTQNTSPRFFQEISDAVPALVAVYNIRTGEYLYVNQAVKKLLGYTPRDFVKGSLQFVASLVHPEDASRIFAENNKALKVANSKKPSSDKTPIINFEYRMRHKDGSYRWLHTDGSVFSRGSDGRVECVLNVSLDITHRKVAEESLQKLTDEKLQRNEEQLQAIIDGSPEVIFVKDANGRYLQINRQYETLFNLERAKVKGKTDYDLFPKKTAEQVRENDKKVFTTGSPLRVEEIVPHDDGLHTYISFKFPLFDISGKPYAVCGIATDITERKRIEEKLRQSEVLFRTLTTHAPAGIYLTDQNGDCQLVNDRWQALAGMSQDEAMGQGWVKAIHPEDKKRVFDEWYTATKTKKPFESEYRFKTPSGKITWLHGSAVSLKNENGETTGYIGTIVDITQRKKIEENQSFLAETNKILSKSLDYKTTLNAVVKLTVPYLSDWCVVHVLSDSGDILRLKTAFINPVKAKLAKEFEEKYKSLSEAEHSLNFQSVLKTGKSKLVSKISEEWFKQASKDKTRQILLKKLNPTSHMLVPLKVHSKKIIGVLSLARLDDSPSYNKANLILAEELAYRAAVALDNARLYKTSQEAVALRDNFISVASHELKTPVTSVKIFTQVLQRHSEQIGDDEAKKNLAKLDKQLNKLIDLIYNLLNISKIQAGRMEFNQKKFDFDSCVHEIVDILQQGETKHKLIIDGKTKKRIYGDEDRIGQVLSNLIVNATKYSPKADRVIIHLSTDRDNVIVCVEDFGIGVAEEYFEKIFERFYRVFDTTDKTFPGLGIGLYISAEIIKRHHGKVWVDSHTGKGSKFYFSLPLVRKKKPNGIKVL